MPLFVEAMIVRSMEMSFFVMPLAQTWLGITMLKATDNICSLHAKKVMYNIAPGQALYMLDICAENRDESRGNTIFMLRLQFIPVFGALHSQLFKRAYNKKRHLHAQGTVSFMNNVEAKFLVMRYILKEREHFSL